jgi:alkylation response protein AidB-like acyl-CoA dehydrogenase
MMQARSSSPSNYFAAQELERYLGDPFDPSSAFSLKRAVELDEGEEYPEEAYSLLGNWGLDDYYIPKDSGGRLNSYEEFAALVRSVARRDLTVAITHMKTFLGSCGVWIAGTETQKLRVAAAIKRREQIAFGLTERDHGSDILSTETCLASKDEGIFLSGEKWLINGATLGSMLVVFARSDSKGGPRGFSLVIFEKNRMADGSYAHLPKVKLHGIRGTDVSGIRFNQCRLSSDDVIAPLGSGLEVVLKLLQITRTLVPALSMGAADTALRVAVSFALDHRSRRSSLFETPIVGKTLIDAFLDLLICDCVATSSTRAIHAATEQMSVLSAIAKYYVPTKVEDAVRDLSLTLGLHRHLRQGHAWGVFQKIERDCAITSLFDGSTAVNLNSIALQLKHLMAGPVYLENNRQRVGSNLSSIFALESPLPIFDPRRLELFNRGQNDIMQGLHMSTSQLSGLKKRSEINTDVIDRLLALTNRFVDEFGVQSRVLADLGSQHHSSLERSPELFAIAKKYCVLHAASACVQMWLHNRETLGEFFARGEWLVCCLERLVISFDPSMKRSQHPYDENIAAELVRLFQTGRSFSIVSMQFPETTGFSSPEFPGP